MARQRQDPQAADKERLHAGGSEEETDNNLSLPAGCAYGDTCALAKADDPAGAVGDGTHPRQAKTPVLFVLDEFPALGHMQAIETAAGLMAGFGVKLWTILQNVGQLKQHYDKSWETFFANCGVITAFGVSDSESLKVLSEMLGRTSIVEQKSSGAVGQALLSGAVGLSRGTA